jgi:hypothetical protein
VDLNSSQTYDEEILKLIELTNQHTPGRKNERDHNGNKELSNPHDADKKGNLQHATATETSAFMMAADNPHPFQCLLCHRMASENP